MDLSKTGLFVFTGLLLTSVSFVDSKSTTAAASSSVSSFKSSKPTERPSPVIPSGNNKTVPQNATQPPTVSTIQPGISQTSKSVITGSAQVTSIMPALTIVPTANTSNSSSSTSTTKKPKVTSVASDTSVSTSVTAKNSKGLLTTPTQKSNSPRATTGKPINTVSPTQKPKGTLTSTPKPSSDVPTTQKPSSTVTQTQKPKSTVVPSQKSTSTVIPTENLNNSTKKTISTPASTQTPNGTDITSHKAVVSSTSNQKLNDSTTRPQASNGSSSSVSTRTPVLTNKPTTQSLSTDKPPTQSSSTQQPSQSTQNPPTQPTSTEKPSTKQASTHTPSTQSPLTKPPSSQRPQTEPSSTEKPVTQVSSSKKPSSEQTPHPTSVLPIRDEFVYINEIMLDKTGGFQKVELLLSKKLDITKYTMVMVDGQTNKTMMSVALKDMVVEKNGLLLVMTFDTSKTLPSMKDKGIGIAIYDTSIITMKDDWTVSEMGLVDALVIGKNYEKVSSHLLNILTPGVNPFILDPNKYGMTKTISRCSSDQLRSTDMYALINPSFGVDNKQKCEDRLLASSEFAIKIKKINCKLLEETGMPIQKHQITVQKIIHYLVKKMNTNCMCGVTRMHIVDPQVHCCDGASVDMKFVAPNTDQLLELKHSYKSFLNSSQNIIVEHQVYPIDKSCHENCCNVPKQPRKPNPQAADDTSKNIKVTVAVIVSCLIVFMIIVIIVIMYMRRKKSAVYQFRMSRLNEEDDFEVDGPEHEDFVGGQEATFDINSR